ncbi:MAG: polyprenol monophosphomannose synthase [Muribaculaceae bacterium]|nr:polyprenol monophosphomannose synthase [Muribaculaceae bacterium]MBR6431749.1 polyprenol monophosphomannose synthase [Muribaculaceae bacterium]
MMKSDSVVIIPTYNEKENIQKMIETVLAITEHQFDILVIDDNSPDGTGDIVDKMTVQYPDRVHIIKRTGKLGLGTAYITGFKWALTQGYDYVIEMDADFSHPTDKLHELQAACATGGADVAVGSRYKTGVNVVNWPMGRVLMSYYASKYVRFITGMDVCDTTAGFVCYRREVLEAIDLDNVEFKGYAFQIEMKFTAHRMGFKIVEVPIVFVNRVLGTSKMNSGIFGEALFGVIKLRLESWFTPKKFQRKTK